MSLVAYEASDESDDDSSISKNIPVSDPGSIKAICLPKKPKEPVKILIPSMNELKDEDIDDVPSKKPKLCAGSGLFGMLPPPKYSSKPAPGFTPYVLTKKKEQPQNISHLKPKVDSTQLTNAVSPNSPETLTSDTKCTLSVAKNVDEPVKDYFSLESSQSSTDKFASEHETPNQSTGYYSELTPSAYSLPFSSSISGSIVSNVEPQREDGTSSQSYLDPEHIALQYPEEGGSSQQHVDGTTEEDLLVSEGFRKLKGKRKEFENVNFIDVNADDQLTNKDEWLMKSLTEEKIPRPSRKKNCMPTQQQKRKHQITYLAFQAKERELDLKNQWSLNNRTRRETQSKYGF